LLYIKIVYVIGIKQAYFVIVIGEIILCFRNKEFLYKKSMSLKISCINTVKIGVNRAVEQ